MRKTRLSSVILPIVVFILAFLVGTAKARGGSFVIGLKQEAFEYVNLYGSGNATGNLSVENGTIDFLVRDPDGIIVQEFLNVSTASFSFTADKNGNYSMCMDNNYEAFNVTVELDYGIEVAWTINEGIGISSSSFPSEIGPPIARPPPDRSEDDSESDYVIGPYLTFQRAAQTLGVIDRGIVFLPFRSLNLTTYAFASATALVLAASIVFCADKRRLNLRRNKMLTPFLSYPQR
jgi:hypothetical protein